MVHHYSMEPHAAIAQVGHDQITVWASTQHPFPVRKELAEMFGLPLARVQVIVPYLGGAYGNKSYTKIEPLVVALARKLGRPVRLALTVEESFKTVRRAAARTHKNWCKARRHHCGAPMHGALPDWRLCGRGATRGAESRVYCRRAVPHSAPAHRYPCRLFQYGQQCRLPWLRCAAARLGLRIADGHHGGAPGPRPAGPTAQKSAARGEVFAPGDLPIDADFHGGLRKAADAIGWGQPLQRGRGRGLACVIKAPLAPSVSSALVRMHNDGSVTLLAGTVEIGQGARMVLSQIVAEELALPLLWVRISQPESGTSPYDQATSSSRSTTLVGLALQAAAQICASSSWNSPPSSCRRTLIV